MTDAEWDSLDLKGKLDKLSACAKSLEADNFHNRAKLLRRVVQTGEDKISVDTILRSLLKWSEEVLV